MTPYQLRQSPAYQAVHKQIVALLQMPYTVRADYWWNEEYARLQQSRDALCPPKKKLTQEERRQHRKSQRIHAYRARMKAIEAEVAL